MKKNRTFVFGGRACALPVACLQRCNPLLLQPWGTGSHLYPATLRPLRWQVLRVGFAPTTPALVQSATIYIHLSNSGLTRLSWGYLFVLPPSLTFCNYYSTFGAKCQAFFEKFIKLFSFKYCEAFSESYHSNTLFNEGLNSL